MTVAGLLLAAGSGSRLGGPKGLLRDPSGVTWLASRVTALRDGGCSPVLVTLGAAAERVRAELPPGAQAVDVPGWQEGMGASLRGALAAAGTLQPPAAAVLVALVDTPGLSAEIVRRLLALASSDSVAQATYGGRAAHPVLIGRDHWAAVTAAAVGDSGARGYLRSPGAPAVTAVECGDLDDGQDVDVMADLPPGTSFPRGV